MKALQTHRLKIGYDQEPLKQVPTLDLELEKGSLTVLMGANGAGKSTLLKTLLGLLPPVEGEVKLLEKGLSSYDRTERACLLAGMLTGVQRPGRMTVSSFIGTGRYPHHPWYRKKQDREVIVQAAERAGIAHLLDRSVSDISDGEYQRTLFGRMIAQGALVWIMDEPMAFLDISGRMRQYDLLQDACLEMGISILISTHDPELAARDGNTCWLMGKGELTEMSTGSACREQILEHFSVRND